MLFDNLGPTAFVGCCHLERIELHSTLTKIREGAFSYAIIF